MLIVVDIDDTLSDTTHREHYLEKEPKDWRGFLQPSEVQKDPPILAAQPITKRMVLAGHEVVLLTGRSARLYETTHEWLKAHFMWLAGRPLHMRADGDYRPAAHVKIDKLRLMGAENRDFMFIDDNLVNLGAVKAEFPRAVTHQAPDCWYREWSGL